MKFRKKPVVVDAHKWDPTELVDKYPHWFFIACARNVLVEQSDGTLHVKTLEDGKNDEAKHVADPGDWIIRGIQGELYPCKPDIFTATYEPA